MRPLLKLEVRSITPEVADTILSDHGANRPLRMSRVRDYAAIMKRGDWVLAQPLLFDQHSRLIDGQHRLRAVSIGTQSVRFACISGYDADDVFGKLDRGAVRHLADFLHLHHHENSTLLAGSARTAFLLANGKIRKNARSLVVRGFTPDELLEWAEANAETLQASIVAVPARIGRVVTRSQAVALHWMMARKDRIMADSFWDDLAGGDSLAVVDPVYVLREKLIQDRTSKARMSAPERLAIIVKAWNAVRNNKKVQSVGLRWRRDAPDARTGRMSGGEEFPEVK